ncbi:putative nuclease HARBI1 isoform X2 [Drosophila biarmipes]|nr:putative nuclease HARBI1 isoform X2 [Drosophila biarmipes]
MLRWSEEFKKKFKIPNCLGIVGGKHVAIKKPTNSDELFLNYKGFHSVLILAICDISYRFTYIDAGAFGNGGEQYAFTKSKFGNDLLSDKLPFPQDSMLNGHEAPYFIVGNDAFPLHMRLMKQYYGKHLDEKEQVFNAKLGETLRCIENAFAILSARWMAFQRTLPNQPYEAQKIIATCCYLHNFLMRESPKTYSITPDSEIPPNTVMTELRPCRRGRPHDFCKKLRNNLREYLNSCV